VSFPAATDSSTAMHTGFQCATFASATLLAKDTKQAFSKTDADLWIGMNSPRLNSAHGAIAKCASGSEAHPPAVDGRNEMD